MNVELKLKRRHPANKYRLGKHVITLKFTKFKLDAKESKELESEGCKHWIEKKETVKPKRLKAIKDA